MAGKEDDYRSIFEIKRSGEGRPDATAVIVARSPARALELLYFALVKPDIRTWEYGAAQRDDSDIPDYSGKLASLGWDTSFGGSGPVRPTDDIVLILEGGGIRSHVIGEDIAP